VHLFLTCTVPRCPSRLPLAFVSCRRVRPCSCALAAPCAFRALVALSGFGSLVAPLRSPMCVLPPLRARCSCGVARALFPCWGALSSAPPRCASGSLASFPAGLRARAAHACRCASRWCARFSLRRLPVPCPRVRVAWCVSLPCCSGLDLPGSSPAFPAPRPLIPQDRWWCCLLLPVGACVGVAPSVTSVSQSVNRDAPTYA